MAQFASNRQRNEADESGLLEQVVKVYRCSTVVKGGRRFSFGGLVVVGNKNGKVGYGYGKANEVPKAVDKGIKEAKKSLIDVHIKGHSIPHQVAGCYGATTVRLVPAGEGTGVIAGGSARAVLELAGVQNVLTKVYGSSSPKNVVKATLNALKNLYSREQIEKLRGVTIQAS